MKRLVMMVLVLVAVGGTTEVNAQGWLKKLGKTVENAAKKAVERNAERKTEDVVDKVFNGEIGKGKKDNNDKNNQSDNDNGNNAVGNEVTGVDATAQSGQQKGQSLEMTYAKSDFVPGDEIFFEDNLINEQMGEFPSQWDLLYGSVEVANIAGRQCIYFDPEGATVAPLMKDMKSYRPDVFTLELDFFANKSESGFCDGYIFRFDNAEKNVLEIEMGHTDSQEGTKMYNGDMIHHQEIIVEEMHR